MKTAMAALMLVVLTGAASAQHDAKGRRYPCLPGRLELQRAAATGSTAAALASQAAASVSALRAVRLAL